MPRLVNFFLLLLDSLLLVAVLFIYRSPLCRDCLITRVLYRD